MPCLARVFFANFECNVSTMWYRTNRNRTEYYGKALQKSMGHPFPYNGHTTDCKCKLYNDACCMSMSEEAQQG